MSGWPGWPRCIVLYTATLPKKTKAEVLNTTQVSCGFPQNFEHDSGSRVSGDQQLPLRGAGLPTSWKFLVSTPKLGVQRCTRFPTGLPGFARVSPSPSDLGSSKLGAQRCARGSRRVSPVSRGFPSELLQRHPKFRDRARDLPTWLSFG